MQKDKPEKTAGIVTSDSVVASRPHSFKLPHQKTLQTIFVLVLVAILALVAYWYNDTYRHTTAHNVDQVIGKFKHSMSGGKTAEITGSVLSSLQPQGYSYQVKPDKAQTMEYKVAAKKLQKTYDRARHILSYQGLTDKLAAKSTTSATPSRFFDNTYVHCSLNVSRPTADYVVQIACANASDYLAVAKQMKQFYDLFAANNPGAQPNFTINDISIRPSRTPGYNTAVATIITREDTPDGAQGVYYYQTPDGTWHYFKSTLLTISCGDYNTVDLKKAYLGERCDGTDSKMSFVQP